MSALQQIALVCFTVVLIGALFLGATSCVFSLVSGDGPDDGVLMAGGFVLGTMVIVGAASVWVGVKTFAYVKRRCAPESGGDEPSRF